MLYQYPVFDFEIFNVLIDDITNYEFLNIEIDNRLEVGNISQSYKKIKNHIDHKIQQIMLETTL